MEYTLRRSSRSRSLKIRVSPQHGIELVVPRGVSEADATRFLIARLDWVRRASARLAVPVAAGMLPERIELAAIGRDYRIERGEGARLGHRGDCLLLPRAWSEEAAAERLREWLRQQAGRHLPAYCERLSRASGLSFRRLRIGLQSSRWGSYSSRGTLSLNAKLLLLPEPVLRYVVHHELAHSLHMNHSAAFWDSLARHEPDWQAQRERLRQLGAALPLWVQSGHRKGLRRRL